MSSPLVASDRREQIAELLAATFAARLDAYAVWNGQMHVSACVDGCQECDRRRRGAEDEETLPHQRDPLTAAVVLRGFATGNPVSGYMINADSASHVFAYDFDTPDGYETARTVGAVGWESGVPMYVEASRRGAHLWGVVEAPLPAKVLRRAMRRLLELSAVAEHPKIELRPAQDSIPPGGYGNSLRLPTMPHQATGARALLRHPTTDEPIAASLGGMLLAVEYAEALPVQGLAADFIPPFDPKAIPPGDRPPRSADHGEDESISSVLFEAYGLQARPGKVVKCPAHEDRSPSLTVFPDDRRIICHSTECEWYNNGHGLGTYQLRAYIGRAKPVRAE